MSETRIMVGDVRSRLAELEANSIHCIVTSPPYWGLRDYGVDGQIGLEATPEDHVSVLVGVFREAFRVLRDDGVMWLNYGDAYAGSWGAQSRGDDAPSGLEGSSMLSARQIKSAARIESGTGSKKRTPNHKPKDLIGLPWMLAFALRADGWWLRSDVIWAKPNCMPESVADRPTRSHEYVFLLTKSARYWYDADAIRTNLAESSVDRLPQDVDSQAGSARSNGGAKTNGRMKAVEKQRGHSRRHGGFNDRWDAMPKDEQMAMGANARDVWTIAPAQFGGDHFATMPLELAEKCIKAGCPAGGTVLDPFGGAGTTGLVAAKLGRNSVLIELNPEYAAMAEKRIRQEAGTLFNKVVVDAPREAVSQ